MHRGQSRTVAGVEEARGGGGGHALVVDPGCWLGSEEGEAEHGFQADPHLMLLTTHALESPLVCKTQVVLPVPPTQRAQRTGEESGVGVSTSFGKLPRK